MRSQLLIKRLFDFCGAVLLLILTAPVMAWAAVLIVSKLGRPILFRQSRPGLQGRPFSLIKFRTMRNAFRPDGRPLPDEERLCKTGRFLRATSMDELPELWNVLRGEMSLVGPRPLLPEYLHRYTPAQMRRHEMMPGITGWAQVSGRNALTWEDRFELDVWYIDNWSIWLDLRILVRTISTVILRKGISSEGHATMPEFAGSKADRKG